MYKPFYKWTLFLILTAISYHHLSGQIHIRTAQVEDISIDNPQELSYLSTGQTIILSNDMLHIDVDAVIQRPTIYWAVQADLNADGQFNLNDPNETFFQTNTGSSTNLMTQIQVPLSVFNAMVNGGVHLRIVVGGNSGFPANQQSISISDNYGGIDFWGACCKIEVGNSSSGNLDENSTNPSQMRSFKKIPTSRNLVTEPIIVLAPNPFDEQTTLTYDLQKTELVSIQLYNNLGQYIKPILPMTTQEAGHYQILINADGLTSGLYFLQIKIGEAFIISQIVKQ